MLHLSHEAITGCLIGTAVGDAMGLPFEGIPKKRLRKIARELDRHHFFLNRGMISDDTEHACATCQALIASGGNGEAFSRELARQLKVWILCFPAGTGYATLRACVKLLLGASPERSGVFSAGNGPAMRSPILGVVCDPHTAGFKDLVRRSTIITHCDPRAERGALSIALAAHMSAYSEKDVEPGQFLETLRGIIGGEDEEFIALVQKVTASVVSGSTADAFAESMGMRRGVGGYMYHTVPMVLHSWLRHQNDYAAAMGEIIDCGGDTDTAAAILGGIIGARVTLSGIPGEWVKNLLEWPRSVGWIEALGNELWTVMKNCTPHAPLRLPIYGILGRNLFFTTLVLLHGFRRLLPPY